jgi:integrase
MFAMGAFCGPRTGEILATDWPNVDLGTRRIRLHQQVQDGRLGPLEDDESRTMPIPTPLLPILTAWKLKTGGTGHRFKPMHPKRGGREGRPATFIRPQTMHKALETALEACKLTREGLDWYGCTRHTFGSLFILAGGSMERLSKLMGHSSVTITEKHCCHLRVDLFRREDYDIFDVDLSPAGEVVPFPQPRTDPADIGCTVVTAAGGK